MPALCRDGESDVDGDLCDNRRTGKQHDVNDEEKENQLYSSVEIISEQKMALEDDFVMIDVSFDGLRNSLLVLLSLFLFHLKI